MRGFDSAVIWRYYCIKAMQYKDSFQMSMGMMNGFDGAAKLDEMTKCAGGGS
jgi:hypothetical protein